MSCLAGCPTCAPAKPACAARSRRSTPSSPTVSCTSNSPTTLTASSPSCATRPTCPASRSANACCDWSSKTSSSAPTRSPSVTASRSATTPTPATPTPRPSPPRRATTAQVIHCVGGVVSPVLANLFLHYAFDAWMARVFPAVPFERYADDGVVHCVSERQAQYVRRAIGDRMAQVGLRLHPDKTRVVYCKDGSRRGSWEHTSFTFLGYTFRARPARGPGGNVFAAFLPAISKEALKRLSRTVRRWQLHRRTELSFAELAEMINPVVRGWMQYYGAFYRSALSMLLARINTYLVRWTRKKYRRLRAHRKARAAWERVTAQFPGYFAHWAWVRHPLMIKMARAE